MTGPEIVTRGWVYAPEAEDLIEDAKQAVRDLDRRRRAAEGATDFETLRRHARRSLGRFIDKRTRRRPRSSPSSWKCERDSGLVDCSVAAARSSPAAATEWARRSVTRSSRAGAMVWVNDLDLERAGKVAGKIGPGCVGAAGDRRRATRLVVRMREETGPVDILVNNVGSRRQGFGAAERSSNRARRVGPGACA